MKILPEKTVLAIDPGHSKCGIALVERKKEGEIKLLWHAVAPVEELTTYIRQALEIKNYSMLIIGSGTNSKAVTHQIKEELPSIGVLLVDEKNTTLDARAKYWEHHPRKGWRRFWPASLQIPPKPIDDYVALILAERVLSGN
ncbi:MAG: RuvC family protein [Acidimicrobiales bacterium]